MRRFTKLFGSSVFLFVVIFSSVSLQAQLAAGKDKFIGNIIQNDVEVPSDFDTYWNQVTPENAGKWSSVESTRDVMQWTNLDRAYDYAKEMGFPFKQHNFIWKDQQPSWITSLDLASQAEEVEEWIWLYGTRYPETDFIDVVNEPINKPPDYKEALGGDGDTGWDWVIWAFEKARDYCPDAQLILNEYNVLHSSTNINKMIQIINLLKERNLIDAIGIQGHYFELSYYSTSTLKSGLDKLAVTGLPIYISEFDIVEADDDKQLAGYQKYFPIFWEHSAVKGITFWGYIQGTMWQANGYLLKTDGTERPAMEWLRGYVQDSSVKEDRAVFPSGFALYPNYPNPFNPTTEIRFSLDEPGDVQFSIFDVLGREILFRNIGGQDAGFHTFRWDGRDASGREVPGGNYVYTLTVTTDRGIITDSKKMVLIK